MKHLVVLLSSLVVASQVWADAPPAAAKGDVTKGKTIVDNVCGACHGPDGNSTAPIYPNLAGQYPEYLNKQLTEFKAGARKNAIMAPNVAKLSADDMRNVAAYFSAQQPRPHLAKDATLVAKGQKLYKGGNPGSGVPAAPPATVRLVPASRSSFPVWPVNMASTSRVNCIISAAATGPTMAAR